jgi:hypothetical protein
MKLAESIGDATTRNYYKTYYRDKIWQQKSRKKVLHTTTKNPVSIKKNSSFATILYIAESYPTLLEDRNTYQIIHDIHDSDEELMLQRDNLLEAFDLGDTYSVDFSSYQLNTMVPKLGDDVAKMLLSIEYLNHTKQQIIAQMGATKNADTIIKLSGELQKINPELEKLTAEFYDNLD